MVGSMTVCMGGTRDSGLGTRVHDVPRATRGPPGACAELPPLVRLPLLVVDRIRGSNAALEAHYDDLLAPVTPVAAQLLLPSCASSYEVSVTSARRAPRARARPPAGAPRPLPSRGRAAARTPRAPLPRCPSPRRGRRAAAACAAPRDTTTRPPRS